MRGFSKAIIAGNVTRDPELRTTPSGSSVCSFSVAINRTYRDGSGEQKESVSFIDCSAWGKLGETISQYAKKGTGIIVSGRLEQRSWDDKNTGQKRSRVEIVADDFVFAGSREGGAGSNSSYSGSTSSQTSDSADSESAPDDIPEGEIDLSEVPF